MKKTVTIAIANQKGGVGKTITTQNIGAALATLGFRVLIIDYDPQASLTVVSGIEPFELTHNIVSVLSDTAPIQQCIVKLKENLDLIGTDLDMAALELQMISRIAREQALKRAVSPLNGIYDFILIDCPPQLSILMLQALTAADGILVPVKTNYLSYRGLPQLLNTISDVQKSTNPKLRLFGIIATLYKTSSKDDNDILDYLQKEYHVLGVVKDLVEANKGVYDGLSAIEAKPSGSIAAAYMQIAKKLVKESKTV